MPAPYNNRCCRSLVVGLVAVGCIACGPTREQRLLAYTDARTVVDRRCVECHSAHPTSRAFPIAPQGVMLDTALEMKQYADRIEASVAAEHTMPLANLSGMTDEERSVLHRWVQTGADVP
ncbi:MAG TPA: hypothetical protein VGG73_00985 [Vicinamibacterales bacterium]|jgi:uncharacterized membrane protein